MNSKYWIERTLSKPKDERKDPAGKRARLAEALLKMKKEKG
jgi:hypothetical protein